MDFYQEKLADIEAQIAALEKAKTHLEQRLKRWHASKIA
jgi:ubiquinone biosynthesis protein UbiJ